MLRSEVEQVKMIVRQIVKAEIDLVVKDIKEEIESVVKDIKKSIKGIESQKKSIMPSYKTKQ